MARAKKHRKVHRRRPLGTRAGWKRYRKAKSRYRRAVARLVKYRRRYAKGFRKLYAKVYSAAQAVRRAMYGSQA